MKNTKHTPTPWKRGANFDIGITGDGFAGGGRTVLHVSNSFGSDVREANAEFIVRAVNSHDELLAIVKLIAERLHNTPIGARCKKAIAQAEGK